MIVDNTGKARCHAAWSVVTDFNLVNSHLQGHNLNETKSPMIGWGNGMAGKMITDDSRELWREKRSAKVWVQMVLDQIVVQGSS